MITTVISTVLSGVLIYLIGQLFDKLVLGPVHEMKKTIGAISHFLVERADVLLNPGLPKEEVIREVSQQLRNFSSHLHAHLFLVPAYRGTARVFCLPSQKNTLSAAKSLMGLSTNLYRATGGGDIYKQNAKRIENICDSLGIYMPEEDRWPKEL